MLKAVLVLYLYSLCSVCAFTSWPSSAIRGPLANAVLPTQMVLNWGGSTISKNAGKPNKSVTQLKKELLAVALESARGVQGTPELKEKVFSLVKDLERVNPTRNPALSPLLTGDWLVEWTTEKETKSLAKAGFFGKQSGPIWQFINTSTGIVENTLLFGEGEGAVSFGVYGTCQPQDNGTRIDFKSTTVALKWRNFSLPLPPIAFGHFDILYLDKDFRIHTDSRDDLWVFSKLSAPPRA